MEGGDQRNQNRKSIILTFVEKMKGKIEHSMIMWCLWSEASYSFYTKGKELVREGVLYLLTDYHLFTSNPATVWDSLLLTHSVK